MAIWQFRVNLIPISSLRAKLGIVPASISQEMADSISWWSDFELPRGFESDVDKFLPRDSSWSEKMTIWGEKGSDAVSVCYTNSDHLNVEWIEFRVDVRSVSHGFVSNLCRIAQRLGCVLLTAENELICSEFEHVIAAINQSTASRYIADPAGTLLSLKGKFR